MDWSEDHYQEFDLQKQDRLNFIRKVYMILSAELLFTAFLTLIVFISEDYKDFLQENWWFTLLCGLCAIIILIALFCCKSVARKYPLNFFLLGLFTMFESLSISAFVSFFEPLDVLLAVAFTALLTTALTLYAIFTKTDFTFKWGLMITISIALIGLIVVVLVLPSSSLLTMIICPIFIIIYGIFLIYDTQLIVGQKRYSLSYDDYILGSIMLYIDIIMIFYYILMFLGERK